MAPTTLTPIATPDSFDATLAALPPATLAVLYFHAPWAEPCKQMATVLSTLAATYDDAVATPAPAFLSLDAEDLSDISERYDVTQVPLVVLQRAGTVLDSVAGTDAARVRAAVERHAGGAPANAAALPPAQTVSRPAEPADVPSAVAAPPAQQTPEELDARLAELVRAAPVMLFMKGTPSKPECGFSRQTVALLRERGVRYGFFNILADDEVRQGLKAYSDWPTFPQVYVDGELVGGLDIVKEEFENDADFLKQYSVQKTATASA